MKLRTEAPVNGGRNYNGPKVNDSLALVKLNYMRETPHTADRYSLRFRQQSKSDGQGDNPQGRLQNGEPSETSRSATSWKAGSAMGRRIRGWRRLFLRRNQSAP